MLVFAFALIVFTQLSATNGQQQLTPPTPRCPDPNGGFPGSGDNPSAPVYPSCLAAKWDRNLWSCNCPALDDCPIGWNGLSVTYTPTPSSSRRGYFPLPTSTANNVKFFPLKDGVCHMGGATTGTNPALPYIGIPYSQYIPNAGTAIDNLRLLFDKNGYIAGIQLFIPSVLMSTAMQTNKLVLKDVSGNGYVTAYLVFPSTLLPDMARGPTSVSLNPDNKLCGNISMDPTSVQFSGDGCIGYALSQGSRPFINPPIGPGSSPCYAPLGVDICTSGRASSNAGGLDGTGRGMWQPLPSESPMEGHRNTFYSMHKHGHIAPTTWAATPNMHRGGCVRGIGVSYLSTNPNATITGGIQGADFTNINPIVPIYNSNRLNGFAFITDIEMPSLCTDPATCISRYGEDTSIQQLEDMFGERNMPRIFYSSKVTMIHFYFTENPRSTASC